MVIRILIQWRKMVRIRILKPQREQKFFLQFIKTFKKKYPTPALPRKPQLNFLWLIKTERAKVGLKVFLWGGDIRAKVIELLVARSSSKLFILGGRKKIQGLLEDKSSSCTLGKFLYAFLVRKKEIKLFFHIIYYKRD